MTAEFLPPIFVSITGLIFPFVSLSLFYNYISKENVN